jgi:hypothetical protein
MPINRLEIIESIFAKHKSIGHLAIKSAADHRRRCCHDTGRTSGAGEKWFKGNLIRRDDLIIPCSADVLPANVLPGDGDFDITATEPEF